MIHPFARTLATTCVLGLLGAACASSSDGFEPGAPIPTDNTNATVETTSPTSPDETASDSVDTTTSSTSTTTTTSPEPLATSTTDATDTTDATTTPATEPESELAPTAQAPGFDFPPADLETDPGSPNNNRAVRPDDVPILEAYLEATKAQSLALAELPLDPNNPLLIDAPFTEDALALFDGGLASRTASNQVLDISGGLTARPYVLEDDDGSPDRAIVWDCQIDATFWKDVDSGEKVAPDAYPNVGPPGVETGTETVMVRVDGVWLVDSGAVEQRACA